MNIKIKRILASLIDFYIICFVASLCIAIVTNVTFSITPFFVITYLVLTFLMLLGKDFIFKNASIGKRIFKLKIIKIDEKGLTFFDILKRNAPVLLLLPLEALLIIVKNKRVGDIWAKTTVIHIDDSQECGI